MTGTSIWWRGEPPHGIAERVRSAVIANRGDQPSGLFGGHAERMALLPNLFYRVR